jgi:hypothetical protein
MNVTFEKKDARVATGEGGFRKVLPVTWVRISTGRDGVDEVVRVATQDDFERFPSEYAAFKGGPVPSRPEGYPVIQGPEIHDTPADSSLAPADAAPADPDAVPADVDTAETDAPRGFGGFRSKRK